MDSNFDNIKELLWDATDYGRQFFLDEFAAEISANRGRTKGFRVRPDDKTGSCHIHQRNSTAPYTFTDFGVDSKGLNAIDYVQQRDHCTAFEALKNLCAAYSVPLPNGAKIQPKVSFSSDVTEEVGTWSVTFADTFQHTKYLRRLFPYYTPELLSEYHFKEITDYTTIGLNDKGNKYRKTIQSTPEFPIFGYDKGDFVKIYQPLAQKSDELNPKHSFVGGKSGNRIVYGWDRLLRLVDYEAIKALNEELKNTKSKELRTELTAELNALKLDTVIIATGGSDGINIASLGYNVIWFNSETEVINAEEYQQLSLLARNIYYVPDLDATGVRQALQVADTFIDIRLVWLPKELKENGKKDFADWLRLHHTAGQDALQSRFKLLLQQSLNFRFWEFSEKGSVQFNPTKVIHFLHLQGYYTYASSFAELKEDECEFVSLKHGCIDRVLSTDIKKFVLQWLDHKVFDQRVRNRVFSAAAFQPSHLKMLPLYPKETPNYGRNYQWYFFTEKAIKVEANTISQYDYKKTSSIQFWHDEVIPHPISLLPPAFEHYTDEQGRIRLRILSTASHYFKVLINSSRIHWLKDACPETEQDKQPFSIHSPNLTDEENYAQELHLMNKIYCVGYLLHQHKRESEAYIVMGTDYKGGNTARGSYGGTGKSFLVNGIRKLLKSKYIDGKTIGANKFPYDKVTEKTRLVFLDDMNFNQDFRDFYNKVTGDFEANHKGGKIFYIPFERSPKMAATTNYVPDFEESSLVRRLLFYQNSNYYHAKTPKNDYKFSRKISDDFGGRDIMTAESPTEEWNADYNFLFNCLQFYLSCPTKIEAPLEALENRRTLLTIGDTFMAFFNTYFSDDTHLNVFFSKPDFNREVQNEIGGKYTSQQIEKKLTDYCTLKQWSLSTEKRKINGISTVCFLIDSNNNEPQNNHEKPEETTPAAPKTNNLAGIEDDIPF